MIFKWKSRMTYPHHRIFFFFFFCTIHIIVFIIQSWFMNYDHHTCQDSRSIISLLGKIYDPSLITYRCIYIIYLSTYIVNHMWLRDTYSWFFESCNMSPTGGGLDVTWDASFFSKYLTLTSILKIHNFERFRSK